MARPYRGNKRSGTWRLVVWLSAVMVGWPSIPAVGMPDSSLEAKVKITYLYKFAPFVQWPEEAFASPSSPFTICVIGDGPEADLLEHAVVGQHVGGRSIVILRKAAVVAKSGCQILYVVGPPDTVTNSVQSVKGEPILTVTDSGNETVAAGIIRFVVENDRVRFEIDDKAASENQLVLSSKLLSLARSVRPRASQVPE